MTETHAPGARGPEGTIPLAVPNIGELERRYVLEAVESGYVSSVGPFVSEFERRFADRVGAKYGGTDLRQMDGPGESRVAVTIEPLHVVAVDMAGGA